MGQMAPRRVASDSILLYTSPRPPIPNFPVGLPLLPRTRNHANTHARAHAQGRTQVVTCYPRSSARGMLTLLFGHDGDERHPRAVTEHFSLLH